MRFIAQGAVMSPAFDAAGLWLLALMGFAATSPNHRIALLLHLTVQRVFRLWRNLGVTVTGLRWATVTVHSTILMHAFN